MTKGRLTRVEYEKLKAEMRVWPKYQVETVAKIVRYVEYLQDEIKRLEAVLASDFFEASAAQDVPSVRPTRDKFDTSWLDEIKVGATTPSELIVKMVKEKKTETEEFKRILKWTKRSLKDAMDLVDKSENL